MNTTTTTTTTTTTSASTFASSRPASKFRSFRWAAAAATLSLGAAAPFASAGPFVLTDKVSVIDKSDAAKIIIALSLRISGPDVITIPANELHFLSEYFSISQPTLLTASFSGAGGVRIFPADTQGISYTNTTAASALSKSIKASSPGSFTLTVTTADGQTASKTAAVVLAPAPTQPTTPAPTTSTTTTTSTLPKATQPTQPTQPAAPVVPASVQPPVVATVPVVTTLQAPAPTVAAPVAPVATPQAGAVSGTGSAGPAVAGGAVANRVPVASPLSVLAGAGASTPLVLQASDPDGSPVSFALAQLPAHGKLTGQAPGLAYTPDSGFVGVDAFTFTASDGKDTSGQATVMVTVTGSSKSGKVAKLVRAKKVRLVCRGKGTRRVCR